METDSRTDAEVIAASWDDIEEFGIIFRRHYHSVFAFVARRIYRSEAADLASEVFMKAMTVRHRYDTSYEHALPWLYGIAANTIGDRMRRIERGQRAYIAVGAGRTDAFGDDRSDDQPQDAPTNRDITHPRGKRIGSTSSVPSSLSGNSSSVKCECPSWPE